MITHYDLFAGIGGFSLALDEVFNDETIKHIFCEWEQFPTAVLKKHWPDGTYYGDIAELVTDTESPERQQSGTEPARQQTRCANSSLQSWSIVTGGFPCQPFSHAGRRKGTADDRYKWPEMFAVIKNVKPEWVIAENVRGLVTWNEGMVLETVCADLESEGYEVQPFIIPAVAVGAPHRRDRVWIIATRNSLDGRPQASHKTSPWEDSANRLLEATNRVHDYWEQSWQEVALATCDDSVDDGLSRRMDGATERGKRTDQISAAKWRKESLKAYGNAIVPQVAMEIFRAIKLTAPKGNKE